MNIDTYIRMLKERNPAFRKDRVSLPAHQLERLLRDTWAKAEESNEEVPDMLKTIFGGR